MQNNVSVVEAASLADVRSRIAHKVVGRERETDLLLAAVAAGRDLMLEGPPGTSKSTLLGAITSEWDIPLVFVEGNADLTPSVLWATTIRPEYSGRITRRTTSSRGH